MILGLNDLTHSMLSLTQGLSYDCDQMMGVSWYEAHLLVHKSVASATDLIAGKLEELQLLMQLYSL